MADGDDSVVLQPSKPTILLAALLLRPNAVVGIPELQRSVWGDDQPATARAALQTCVLRVRQLFAKYGIAGTTIETVPGGYRIVATAATLDLVRFHDLLRRATSTSDMDGERRLLDEALALWRGPLLANVPSESLHREVLPRLVEERLRAIERVCDIRLAQGMARAALPELFTVTRAYPGHERFVEQLARALYRTGRQAEALAEIRRTREYLREEMGLDISATLRGLELTILRGGELDPPAVKPPQPPQPSPPQPSPSEPPAPRTPTTATSTQAPQPLPMTRVGPDGRAPVVADVPCFAGRAALTAAIRADLARPASGVTVLILTGPPGVGKTALARHVAYAMSEATPGGQALVSMSDSDGRHRPVAEITAELRACISPGGDGRRALVILDDAGDGEQVRKLLPECAGALVLITTAMSLTGVVARAGARTHRLPPLATEESRELLVAMLGAERIGAEMSAVDDLAAVCGHFPLAIRIAGARLLTRPRLRVADVLAWLREDRIGRLTVADDPELSMAHRLQRHLGRLEPAIVTAFLRLGNAAEPSFTAASASALLGSAPSGVEQTLDHLVDANLLEEASDRYTMPELLQAFAVAARAGTTAKPYTSPAPARMR